MSTSLLQDLSSPSPQRQRLLIYAGWLVIIIGCVNLLGQLPGLFALQTDFTQDYLAVELLREGRSIYTPFTAAQVAAHDLEADLLQNFHPPTTVILLLPSGLLPYKVAITLWTLLSVGLYLWIWRLVLDELGLRLPVHLRPLLVGLSLFWHPFQFHILVGQVALPLTACIVGAWVALRRGRNGLAGTLIALAVLIKIYPALFVLLLLLRRKWHAFVLCTLVGLAGLALTIAIVGLDDLLHYQLVIVPWNLREFLTAIHNVSLRAALARTFVGDQLIAPLLPVPALAGIGASVANVALGLWACWLVWRQPPGERGDTVSFALFCAVTPLLTPTSWNHGFALLILPFVLVVQALYIHRDQIGARLALLAFVFVSLPTVPLYLLQELFAPAHLPAYVGLFLLLPTAGLILLCWLVYSRLCRPTRPQAV